MMLARLVMAAGPAMVVVREDDVKRDEAPPHGAIGMAAYLYKGAIVGIRLLGEQPLSIIVSYYCFGLIGSSLLAASSAARAAKRD